MLSRRLYLLWNSHNRMTSFRFFTDKCFFYKHNLKNVNRSVNNIIPCNSKLVSTCTTRLYSQASESLKDCEKHNDNDDYDGDLYENQIDENGNKRRINELMYTYSVLKKSNKPLRSLVNPLVDDKNIPDDEVEKILAKNHEDSNLTEILEDIRTVCLHARSRSLEMNERHTELFNHVISYIPSLLDDQLKDLLNLLELWFPKVHLRKQPSFQSLLEKIDAEFCQRINNFTPDEMLTICDHFFHCRRLRKSNFVNYVLYKLGLHPKRMSLQNYLHYFFILVTNSKKPAIKMYELEYALEFIIEKFNADELGVISLGFFKTKTPIRNTILLNRIIEKLIAEIDTVGEISLTGIMKIVRYSIGLSSQDRFNELLDVLVKRLDNMSVPSLVHTIHAIATVLNYRKDVVDKVFERLLPMVPEARLKDLERMLFVLVIFNYPKNSPIYDVIIEKLRSPAMEEQCYRFPTTFSTTLKFLAYADIYPLDIIKRIMDPKFIEVQLENNPLKLGQTYLTIESSLQIEVPEYEGPFLIPKLRSYLNNKYRVYSTYQNDDSYMGQFHSTINTLEDLIKEILDSDKWLIEQPLPHISSFEMILGVDNKNNYVSPKEYILPSKPGEILHAPKSPQGYKWLCLSFATYNHIFRNTSIKCGASNFKLRQLEKLGYTPITISHKEWNRMNMQKKRELVHGILRNNGNI